MDTRVIREQIKRHEGKVLHAYPDHLGYWTIGYGRLIDERRGGGITEAEAEEWAAGAAVPQWVSDAIEAAVAAGSIPEDERLGVRIAVRTQDTIGRTDRLIPILADSKDLTPEQVDALFGIA